MDKSPCVEKRTVQIIRRSGMYEQGLERSDGLLARYALSFEPRASPSMSTPSFTSSISSIIFTLPLRPMSFKQ